MEDIQSSNTSLPTIESIEAVKPLIEQKKEDERDVAESRSVESKALRMALESHKEQIQDRRENRELRSDHASKIIRFLIGYSLAAGGILLLNGWGLWGFSLPDNVLLTITGSTAAAAIGLVGFVAKGLFPTN